MDSEQKAIDSIMTRAHADLPRCRVIYMLHNFFCGVTRIKGAQDELAVQPSCWPTWRGVLLLWCRRQFQILALYVGVANPWIVDPWTCGSKISAEFRELITDYHNSVRSKIAHGMERNHTGKLPSAKNMYEVVSVVLYGTCRRADEKISISQCTSYYIKAWDCELEKLAEKIAADEDFDLESIHPRAANIDHRAHCQNFELNYYQDINKSLKRWNYEVREFGQTDPKNLYNDDSLEHFANVSDRKDFSAT
ncbi:hypothetical protein Y032_0477g2172 [Ancylostoma ceylanicum]|uniref:SCP domain-containing protein n=1 Tax=Ancylostoma ceylanicum TaxID=53326 RepID=A0A016WXZ0_9BILA|nr:hypothetical protein Y032_0477g2172 [Ancylostoma ceylanicum]